MKVTKNIYLASNSPRRKAMFQFFNIPFKTLSVNFDETFKSEDPEEICREICKKKIDQSVKSLSLEQVNSSIIVVADTLVTLNGKIFGKPKDKIDAREMLESLSGKVHSVITAVGISNKSKKEIFLETTQVKFIHLTDEMIELYLNKEEFLDKAGSYAIQSDENFFVESIEGSYLNVVGFPMEQFLAKIK